MANKAAKRQAQQNTRALNVAHVVTAIVHGLFIALRRVVFGNLAGRSLAVYLLLSLPSLILEYWLEKIGRPRYVNGELRRSGEDLSQKGLTEYCWDVIYWTWGCVVLAALLGDWAWWLWAAIPLTMIVLATNTIRHARPAG